MRDKSAIVRCEHCGWGVHEDEAIYLQSEDEYVCELCADRYADKKHEEYIQHLKEHDDG